MNVLILGGNGFIGEAIARQALAAGHDVTCLGRNIASARARLPDCEWVVADLAEFTHTDKWQDLVRNHDVIVNAAGALQDGARDDLASVQELAMLALYGAFKPGEKRIIQISANTSGSGSNTKFMATKHAADTALKASGHDYLILRPALVIGRNAHGGTALIRSIAAMPLVCPVTFPQAEFNTTDLDDLAACVVSAFHNIPTKGRDCNIADDESISMRDLAGFHRRWLGLSDGRIISFPDWVANFASRFADLAGWLGWRSPLRSTAIEVLRGGVLTDPELPTIRTGGVGETFRKHAAGVQDLWAARLYLLKPVMIVTLAAFWIITGIIALMRFDHSVAIMATTGMDRTTASLLTAITSLADIASGALVLWRRTAVWGLLGMIGLSFVYLVGGTLLSPHLWLDPLGPYVKVLPSITLALVSLSILRER